MMSYHILNWVKPANIEGMMIKPRVLASSVQKPADLSFRVISSLGYVLRYWLGQQNPRVIAITTSSGTQMALRKEIQSQHSEKADQLKLKLHPQWEQQITYLEKNGVTVVGLLVPTKLSLERSKYPEEISESDFATATPRLAEDSETMYKTLIEPFSSIFPNLHLSFRDFLHENPSAHLYPPRDYHWNPLGESVAVGTLVNHLISKGWKLSTPRIEVLGDSPLKQETLVEFFQLPQWFINNRSELNYVNKSVRTRATNHDSRPSRIVLAGSSFSVEISGKGLGSDLKRIFNRPLVNYSVNGGGYSGSFIRMAENGFQFKPGDLFVWEIPLGFLGTETETLPFIGVRASGRREVSQ